MYHPAYYVLSNVTIPEKPYCCILCSKLLYLNGNKIETCRSAYSNVKNIEQNVFGDGGAH